VIKQQHLESKANAEREAGHPLTWGQVGSFWYKKGTDWIVRNPGAYARIEALKVLTALQNGEKEDAYSIEMEKDRLESLGFAPVPYGVLLVLGVGGLILSLFRWRIVREKGFGWKVGMLILLAGIVWVTLLLFFVHMRYRIPLTVVWILFSGCFVAEVGGRCFGTETHFTLGWRAKGAILLVLVLLGVVSFRSGPKTGITEIAWNNLGGAYFAENKVPAAREAFDKAIDINPAFAHAYLNLALCDLAETPPKVAQARARLEHAKALGLPIQAGLWKTLEQMERAPRPN